VKIAAVTLAGGQWSEFMPVVLAMIASPQVEHREVKNELNPHVVAHNKKLITYSFFVVTIVMLVCVPIAT
jgi:hypothetical protein